MVVTCNMIVCHQWLTENTGIQVFCLLNSSVDSGIGSRSTMTLTRRNGLLKRNEWINRLMYCTDVLSENVARYFPSPVCFYRVNDASCSVEQSISVASSSTFLFMRQHRTNPEMQFKSISMSQCWLHISDFQHQCISWAKVSVLKLNFSQLWNT